VQGTVLDVLILTRTMSVLKLRMPGDGLTESRMKEDACNIWPECFCSFRWFKNVFLIVNTKKIETPGSIQE